MNTEKTIVLNAIKKYGIGSCGPREFYGTFDVHLELEEYLGKDLFGMGDSSCIVYPSLFAAITSIIPAFVHGNSDAVVLCDEACYFPIQVAIRLSGTKQVRWFKHNDVKDLEKYLNNEKKGNKKKLFIIVEALYTDYGDYAPLKEIVELKSKYDNCSLILDESNTFGTLGSEKHLGLFEYEYIPIHVIDFYIGSLENNVINGMGGFCIAHQDLIKYQTLNGNAYCFSASLPPAIVQFNLESLKKIPDRYKKLQLNITDFYSNLSPPLLDKIRCPHVPGSNRPLSTIIHINDDDGSKNTTNYITQGRLRPPPQPSRKIEIGLDHHHQSTKNERNETI